MTAATRTRTPRLGLLAGLLTLACLVLGAQPALAAQQVDSFDSGAFEGSVVASPGNPMTQAGGHPGLYRNSFVFAGFIPPNVQNRAYPKEYLKDAIVKLPVGFVGNPQALPSCSMAQLVSNLTDINCPLESQVGGAGYWATNPNGVIGFSIVPGFASGNFFPVWNMGAADGTPSVLAFSVLGTLVFSSAEVRSGDDYGLNITTPNNPAGVNYLGITYDVWGDPQDPSHDAQRGVTGGGVGCYLPFGSPCPAVPSSAPNVPFLSLPTSCSAAPPLTSLLLSSWEHPGDYTEAVRFAHDNTAPFPNPVTIDGCNALDFTPSLQARPTTNVADAPSGLDVDLQTPQNQDPHGTSEANLKDSTVTLPQGLVLNPSSANGLGTCSLSQIGYLDAGDEQQTVSLAGIGPFTLTFDGQTTAQIPGGSDAGAVQAALEALPNVDPGDAIVTGSAGGPYKVEFAGQYAGQSVPLLSADGLTDKVQRIAVDASGGSFNLTYGASTTLNMNAGFTGPTPATIEVLLNRLTSVTSAGGSISVSGGTADAGANHPYYVTFDGGAFAGTDQSISATNVSLSGGAHTITVTDVQAAGQPASGTVVVSREAGHLHFTPDPADCPAAARLASAEIDTPLLDHPMEGSVYLAKPFDNPFNNLISLYITANDVKTGIVIKLAGHVELDQSTGQVKAVFDDNPQLPFEHLKLHFFGGSSGALRTPAVCGDYQTTSSLTPWSAPDSGPPATPSDNWSITQGAGGGSCSNSAAEEPNSPSLDAGTISPLANNYSPLVVNLTRQDGSQQFKSVTLTPPPGLLGKLAGIPACTDAQIAQAQSRNHDGDGATEQSDPSCPAASKVGIVDVAAGAGPAPYWAKGTVYMGGPLNGAPLSFVIITPAVAGPFDLGVVVTRVAVNIDPTTSQITTTTVDPIPAILDGIPLDVTQAKIRIDRDSFIHTGTSCDPLSFTGSLLSTQNQSAPLSQRYQLGECSSLAFKPRFKISLRGGKTRNGHPAFTTTINYPTGNYANLAKAQVILPKQMQLDQSHIKAPCTRPQFAANQCPAASVIGTATATSPLVDYALTGPVYLRTGDNPLPDVVLDLHGPASQPIHIVQVGTIDTVHARLRTTFSTVPDAPLSHAVVSLVGGHKGLLVNNTNICRQKDIASLQLEGHNGKTADSNPAVKVAGCPKPHKRKHHKKHKRHHRRHHARHKLRHHRAR